MVGGAPQDAPQGKRYRGRPTQFARGFLACPLDVVSLRGERGYGIRPHTRARVLSRIAAIGSAVLLAPLPDGARAFRRRRLALVSMGLLRLDLSAE